MENKFIELTGPELFNSHEKTNRQNLPVYLLPLLLSIAGMGFVLYLIHRRSQTQEFRIERLESGQHMLIAETEVLSSKNKLVLRRIILTDQQLKSVQELLHKNRKNQMQWYSENSANNTAV